MLKSIKVWLIMTYLAGCFQVFSDGRRGGGGGQTEGKGVVGGGGAQFWGIVNLA